LLYRGPIPAGFDICHHCDTPSCVNPAHLFLGTPADNSADMVRKGRVGKHHHRGSANPRAKLTEEMIQQILASGEPGTVLAKRLGVSSTTVYFARQGKTWTGVERSERRPRAPREGIGNCARK
jgi:hypothetical protein